MRLGGFMWLNNYCVYVNAAWVSPGCEIYLENGSIWVMMNAIALFTIQIKLSNELRAIWPEVGSSSMPVVLVE